MTNEPTYKAVIIGLTGIGARRPEEPQGLPIYGAAARSHAAAYDQHPRTEVVGVCDIRPEALETFKQDWGDVWPDVTCYTDYQEMLDTENPDLVSVVTPDHVHADITVAAANHPAVRAILCEKPIATTLADADRMIAAAAENDVLLSIEHTRRWAPLYHAARELVRSGEYGPLRSITVNMYSPRAMLFRNGTHMVDMLNFFAESEPQWVFAELEEGFDHFTEYKSDGGHDPATDPAATAYVHYANGVRGIYHGVKVSMPGLQFELLCDKARIEVSDRELVLIRGESHYAWSRTPMPAGDYLQTHQLGAVAELVHVLEEGGDLISPGEVGRQAVAVMLGMLKSHADGNVRVNL